MHRDAGDEPARSSEDATTDRVSVPRSNRAEGAARYEVGGEVARGGLGRILRAHDRRLSRPVAIKELLPQDAQSEERFLREALITARLEHPSIVPVHDAGRWPSGAPFYTMKLISGQTLAEQFQGRESLAERLPLLPHVIAVCEAVAYAHAEQIIHRDLKPQNILIGPFGETVVIDWGLAKDLRAPHETPCEAATAALPDERSGEISSSDALTALGAVVGTPAYMPPEQASGEPVDARADVYALGAILYHLLAGCPPYPARTGQRTLAQVRAKPPRPLDEVQPQTPRDLAAIVEKAMARDLGQRYPSARELADDLKKFQAGQLVGAHKYSTREILRRWAQRNRTALVVAVTAALVLLVVGLTLLVEVINGRQVAEMRQREAEASALLARGAAQEATVRLDALRLEQARAAVERDPARALDLLAQLSPEFPHDSAARVLAAAASDQPSPRRLRGHERSIYWIERSPDGRYLASAGLDGSVRLWDLAQGSSWRLSSGGDLIYHLAFSTDGRYLASAGGYRDVLLWDIHEVTQRPPGGDIQGRALPREADFISLITFCGATPRVVASGRKGLRTWELAQGGEERPIQGIPEPVIAMTCAPDQRTLVAATLGGGIWRLDMEAPSPVPVKVPHSGALVGWLQFSQDGSRLAGAAGDGVIYLWEVPAWRSAAPLVGHNGRVVEVHFTPDNTRLVSCGDDRTARIWDLSTGISRTLSGHERAVLSVAVSPDGARIATGSDDQTVRLWDAKTGELRQRFLHRDAVFQVLFSTDGQTIIASGAEPSIALWARESSPGEKLPGHQAEVWSLAFSPRGDLLASSDLANEVRIWPLGCGTPPCGEPHVLRADPDDLPREPGLPAGAGLQELTDFDPVQRARGILRHVAFSPDGKTLAVAGLDGRVYLWDTLSWARRTLRGHTQRVRHLAFSPDGKHLATASLDGSFGLWDLQHDSPPRMIPSGTERVYCVVFAPDGSLLAGAALNGEIFLLDPRTGEERGRIQGHEVGVYNLSFSPDSAALSFSGYDGAIRRCEVKGRTCQQHQGHSLVAFFTSDAPDSKTIASAGYDGVVGLWTPSTGGWRALRGHQLGVRQALFSPDGQTLASAGLDGELRLWDIPTGESRALRGHEGAIMALAFSPDGGMIATGGADGSVRLWRDTVPREHDALRAWIQAQADRE